MNSLNFVDRNWLCSCGQRTRLCDIGEFERSQARNHYRLKTNEKDKNQKPTEARSVRTSAAVWLKVKITTSCPNIAKPYVSGSFYLFTIEGSDIQ